MPASVGFAFDGTNPKARRAALAGGARLVREVSEETKEAIRRHIADSIRRGVPPVIASRRIRELVGLTARQTMAVANFRDNLANSGLLPFRVDAAVNRYATKKLRERSMNIARTETMKALNRGWAEGITQAKRQGRLSDDAVGEIIVTPDDRLCTICAPKEGTQVELQNTGDHPPFHPQCRCTMGIGTRKASSVPPRVPSVRPKLPASRG